MGLRVSGPTSTWLTAGRPVASTCRTIGAGGVGAVPLSTVVSTSRAIGVAQHDVVQQRLLAEQPFEHRPGGRGVHGNHRRMANQQRRHGIEAAEIFVEKGGGGRREPSGLGFDLLRPLETQAVTGPEGGGDHGQQENDRCHSDLPEDGLRSKKFQRFSDKF